MPRGINTIRGRKCGNPQQRAPSLNTNNQRPPNNTDSALLSWLLFHVWASENLLLSSPVWPSCSQWPIIKEDNLTGVTADFGRSARKWWTESVLRLDSLYIKYYSCSVSHMAVFINTRSLWEGKRTRSPYQFIQRCPRAGSRQIIILRGSTQSVIPPVLSSVVRLKTCNCALSVCVKSGCRSPRGGLGLKSLPHVVKCLGIFPSQTVLRLRDVGMWCVARLTRKLKICSFITPQPRCASRGQSDFICRFLVSFPYYYYFLILLDIKWKNNVFQQNVSLFYAEFSVNFLIEDWLFFFCVCVLFVLFFLRAKRIKTNHSW